MQLTKGNKNRLRHILEGKIKKAKTNFFIRQELKNDWGLDCDDYEPDKFNQ